MAFESKTEKLSELSNDELFDHYRLSRRAESEAAAEKSLCMKEILRRFPEGQVVAGSWFEQSIVRTRAYRVDVFDPDLIPRKFWTPNKSLMKSALKKGELEAEGPGYVSSWKASGHLRLVPKRGEKRYGY